MKQGFELNINGNKYRFRCEGVSITKTKNCFYSNNVNLQISVFDENDNGIKLDRDSYVAEKAGDFIRNCVNGQDSIYWDWDKPSRHLEKKKKRKKKLGEVTIKEIYDSFDRECIKICDKCRKERPLDYAICDNRISIDGDLDLNQEVEIEIDDR